MPFLGHNSTWNRYETAYGEHRPVPLADGSVINLNTNSCVWARITRTAREISLERGEAFFTVAHDPSRPFKVNVDADVFTAKGTKFSVQREPMGVIRTYVLDGAVEVPNHNGIEGSSEPVPPRPLTAKAGSAVVITSGQTDVQEIGLAAVQEKVAWTGGNIVIDGTLADAVEEFNRYNRRRLEVANPSDAGRRIQGIYKATDPDAFAQDVQNTLRIRVMSTGSAREKTGVIRLGAIP
jgi:transmembrane sensor